MAKASAKDVFIDQERRCGDRRRSDTVVVRTVNYAIRNRGMETYMDYFTIRWKHTDPGFWGEYERKFET